MHRWTVRGSLSFLLEILFIYFYAWVFISFHFIRFRLWIFIFFGTRRGTFRLSLSGVRCVARAVIATAWCVCIDDCVSVCVFDDDDIDSGRECWRIFPFRLYANAQFEFDRSFVVCRLLRAPYHHYYWYVRSACVAPDFRTKNKIDRKKSGSLCRQFGTHSKQHS